MKTIIYKTILSLFVCTLFLSCNKETCRFVPERQFTEDEMVWVTPNGYIIPAIERHNWEEYVKTRFNALGKKKYSSEECVTEGIACGLRCVEGGIGDCSKSSDCAPCMNCGCTPIRSPY